MLINVLVRGVLSHADLADFRDKADARDFSPQIQRIKLIVNILVPFVIIILCGCRAK